MHVKVWETLTRPAVDSQELVTGFNSLSVWKSGLHTNGTSSWTAVTLQF